MKKIVLVGKPNSGKSLLFNQLTGLRQKVANYPGVTVELKSGRFEQFELIDYPGAYSLSSLSRDEEIAVSKLNDALQDPATALVICNLDATRLESSLMFGLQVQALARRQQKAVVFALNMADELQRFGHQLDTVALSAALGSPVFAISAKTLLGIHEFRQGVLALASAAEPAVPSADHGDEQAVRDLSRSLSRQYGIQASLVLKNQNRIDAFMLNNLSGGLAFLAVMFFVIPEYFHPRRAFDGRGGSRYRRFGAVRHRLYWCRHHHRFP